MADVPHSSRCGAALEGRGTNNFVSSTKVTLMRDHFYGFEGHYAPCHPAKRLLLKIPPCAIHEVLHAEL